MCAFAFGERATPSSHNPTHQPYPPRLSHNHIKRRREEEEEEENEDEEEEVSRIQGARLYNTTRYENN